MDDLRRLTVKVLLALLVFLVVGDFLDDLIFDNRVGTPVQFYILIGGMITGLFTPEIIRKPPVIPPLPPVDDLDKEDVGVGHL